MERLAEETQTIAGLTPLIALSYELSAMGLVEKVSVAIGGTADAVTDYEYDPLGRVTKIEQYGVQGGNTVAEKRIDLTYDAGSRYAAISYYSDLDGLSGDLVMTAAYAYDTSGRLIDLIYTDSASATIREFEWFYDAASRIVGHDSDIASEDVSDYDYDATNQLTEADYVTGSDESYVYDSNGNRVLVDGAESYTTGENNQTTSDGTFRYEYDAEGNLIYRYIDEDSSETLNTGDTDVTEYVWDHRNRLTDVVHKAVFGGSVDWTAEYVYDALNHRIGALYDIDGDSDVDLEERYVWQGKNVALDFVDADGVGETESLELARRYLWGQAVDQLLAQETFDDGGVENVLYFVRDNLGSTRSLVDYLGQITATYSYDSYGNVSVLAGTILDTRYGYTCQEYDAITAYYQVTVALNYYDARWYDPTVGKFVSEDPVAADMNLYRYVQNNPMVNIDPYGEKCVSHYQGRTDKKERKDTFFKKKNTEEGLIYFQEVNNKGIKEYKTTGAWAKITGVEYSLVHNITDGGLKYQTIAEAYLKDYDTRESHSGMIGAQLTLDVGVACECDCVINWPKVDMCRAKFSQASLTKNTDHNNMIVGQNVFNTTDPTKKLDPPTTNIEDPSNGFILAKSATAHYYPKLVQSPTRNYESWTERMNPGTFFTHTHMVARGAVYGRYAIVAVVSNYMVGVIGGLTEYQGNNFGAADDQLWITSRTDSYVWECNCEE